MRRGELHFLFTVEEVIAACEAKAQFEDEESERPAREYEVELAEWQEKARRGEAVTDRPRKRGDLNGAHKRKAEEYRRWGRAFKRLHGHNLQGKVALHMDDIEYFGLAG